VEGRARVVGGVSCRLCGLLRGGGSGGDRWSRGGGDFLVILCELGVIFGSVLSVVCNFSRGGMAMCSLVWMGVGVWSSR
jgi:hypothetical protein